jgi:hypothetical protein
VVEFLSRAQQQPREEGRMVQHAAGQARSLERREDPVVYEESYRLPSISREDLGLSEFYVDSDAKREELRLESEAISRVITTFLIVSLLGLLLVMAIVKLVTVRDLRDARPVELSSLDYCHAQESTLHLSSCTRKQATSE